MDGFNGKIIYKMAWNYPDPTVSRHINAPGSFEGLLLGTSLADQNKTSELETDHLINIWMDHYMDIQISLYRTIYIYIYTHSSIYIYIYTWIMIYG